MKCPFSMQIAKQVIFFLNLQLQVELANSMEKHEYNNETQFKAMLTKFHIRKFWIRGFFSYSFNTSIS